MAAPRNMTRSERVLRAKLASHTRWARTPDRRAATAKAREAFMGRFEREVDPEGKLPPHVRAKLAENARSAYYTRLALRSVQARRKAA